VGVWSYECLEDVVFGVVFLGLQVYAAFKHTLK